MLNKPVHSPFGVVLAYGPLVHAAHTGFNALFVSMSQAAWWTIQVSHPVWTNQYDVKILGLQDYRICACISRTLLTRIYFQNWWAAYTRNIMSFVDWAHDTSIVCCETASVLDCYLASYCTRADAPTHYRCIGIFWLHESSRNHRFPEVGRPWNHWQITVNAAGDNWSAANAIANISLPHS
jgi:hypothetical protein